MPYATTDATICRKYWTDWPNAAIAVETGKWNTTNIIAVMITDKETDEPPYYGSHRIKPPEWIELAEEEESHTVMFHQGDDDVFLFRAGPGGAFRWKTKTRQWYHHFRQGPVRAAA